MSSTKQDTRRDVYQEVTDAVLEALDAGTVPWRKPWVSTGNGEFGQCNLQSKRPYRGINQFLCAMRANAEGFSSPYWTTFRAAKKSGGSVRKGERGQLVTFWKRIEVKDEQSETGKKTVFMLRHYVVFNTDQVDGLDVPAVESVELEPVDVIDAGEQAISAMVDPPTIAHGGGRAFYRPSSDHVQLPERDAFETADAYYHTAFHELAHSTGHEKRLGRDGIMDVHRFGDADYSREELIAEFGAAMVSGSLGISPDIPQSAAYIASWRRELGRDKKLVLAAAGKGQKAADRILGVQFVEMVR